MMVNPMDMTHPDSRPDAGFRVSPQAVARLEEIVAAQPAAGAVEQDTGTPGLRVSVLAGGCNGFQYQFALDDAVRADDTVIPAGRTRVLVDSASLDLLAGAELHFTDALMGAHFTVRNPNATSSCGCGTSFSID